VSRPRIDVRVPALALRRAEAAAALGVSLELFDEHVRPYVPAGRLGSVTVYPVAGLAAWLDGQASAPITELRRTAA
jgi:hypothetical protein